MKMKEFMQQYKKAMEVYQAEMEKYNQDLENYHKDRKKCEKADAKLIRIEMKVVDPKRKDGSIYFHISRKGYRKMIKAYDKHAVDVKWPNGPDEPLEPYLQVSKPYRDESKQHRDDSVPF